MLSWFAVTATGGKHFQKRPVGILHQKRQQGRGGSGLEWMYIHSFLVFAIIFWFKGEFAMLQKGGLLLMAEGEPSQ